MIVLVAPPVASTSDCFKNAKSMDAVVNLWQKFVVMMLHIELPVFCQWPQYGERRGVCISDHILPVGVFTYTCTSTYLVSRN